jgi:haloalkane dehalogenase
MNAASTFDVAPPLPSWLLPAMPFTRRLHRDPGGTMAFVDHGEGPVVLMVHGNPTWSFLWRKVIAALGSGFRVIAPDLLGLGQSDKPRRVADHSLSRHIERVARLVEALELERLILVGQDWGGPIGAGLALHAPDRIAAALFANTAILSPARPFRPTAFHRFSHLPLISDLTFRGLGFPLQVLGRVQGDRRSIGAFERRAYRWPLARRADRAAPLAFARMVPDREDHPSTAVLDRIGAFWSSFGGPTALVWGERDPLLGRSLRRHQRAMPNAEVTATEAGHFLQEEVPEVLAQAIRRLAVRI